MADKQKNILADMELDMEEDKEVDKVADMVAGRGCWLIGPKLFRPEPYPPTCMSSKHCEFIFFHILSFFASFSQHVSMVTNILSKVFTNFCKFGDIVVDREGGMIFSESPPFPFLISQY